MAHKHGARHIAAVILPGQAHIQDDRIAVLEDIRAGIVVRLGAVGAKADQRLKAGLGGAKLIGKARVQRGGFIFAHAGVQARDGLHGGMVVFMGAFAHPLQLLRVLVHARVVHAAGADHRADISARIHQADGKVAWPQLVNADGAGLQAVGQDAHAVLGVVIFDQLCVDIAPQGKEPVGVQAGIALIVDIQRYHALAGGDPLAGKIKQRGGCGNQRLLQVHSAQVFSHARNAGCMHKNASFQEQSYCITSIFPAQGYVFFWRKICYNIGVIYDGGLPA